MEFLRTLSGILLPEHCVGEIGPREERCFVTGCGHQHVVHHHVFAPTASSGSASTVSGHPVSARELARFVKACEAPNAPAQRGDAPLTRRVRSLKELLQDPEIEAVLQNAEAEVRQAGAK